MSERQQHTSAGMRAKMLQRYGDCFHHKHDKNHQHYRQHCRSHPVITHSFEEWSGEQESRCSTGIVREFKLKKIRKRLARGQYH